MIIILHSQNRSRVDAGCCVVHLYVIAWETVAKLVVNGKLKSSVSSS